jgi:hypothetical protein
VGVCRVLAGGEDRLTKTLLVGMDCALRNPMATRTGDGLTIADFALLMGNRSLVRERVCARAWVEEVKGSHHDQASMALVSRARVHDIHSCANWVSVPTSTPPRPPPSWFIPPI